MSGFRLGFMVRVSRVVGVGFGVAVWVLGLGFGSLARFLKYCSGAH